MARTFRRLKSKKSSHNHSNSKYWFYDYVCKDGIWQRVLKEGKEYQKAWHKYHGENGPNGFTPSRFYRNNREVQLRRVNKAELHKFKTLADHEPICRENPKSHYWDWS